MNQQEQARRGLCGTMAEQIAHLGMHLAGESCPVADLPKTGVQRHVYQFEPEQKTVKRFAPTKDPRGDKPDSITDREWIAFHSVQAQNIRAVLKKAGRPVATNDLMDAIEVSRTHIRRLLCVMVKVGVVKVKGSRGAMRSLMWELVA